MKADRSWIVLIADLTGSRTLAPRRRAAVDRALERAATRTTRRYPHAIRLAPQVLRGDELQAVLRPDAPALAVLTCLRAEFRLGVERAPRLRAGLGSGPIARLSPKGPFASDGEAFHRARAAIERVERGSASRLTAWITGNLAFDRDVDPVLALADALVVRWTRPQWEAILGRLEEKGLERIARERGVTFQSVSKRLRAASWNEVAEVYSGVERDARGAVQRQAAESPDSASRGRA
jgi:SatD family (SatD)